MVEALIVGTLIKVERCKEFDCRLLSTPNARCEVILSVDPGGRFGEVVGVASYRGKTYSLHWFQTGSRDGLHGQVGSETLSLFLVSRRLKSAYHLKYFSEEDYVRSTCAF